MSRVYTLCKHTVLLNQYYIYPTLFYSQQQALFLQSTLSTANTSKTN